MPDIKQWPGLFSDVDPHDNPGAEIQSNCMSISPGKLVGRAGVREAHFDNTTARGGGNVSDITSLPDIIHLTSFRRPDSDLVVYLDSTGVVRVGRAPS